MRAVATAALYFIHPDHLARPQKITDASQAIVWDGQFRPFGEAHAISAAIVAQMMFPGQLYDPETQLHQNWHRDYDPSTGRYIQSDPIGLAGGINTYGYVAGNPVSKIDPDGRIPLLVIPGLCAMGGCEALLIGSAIVLTPSAPYEIAKQLDGIWDWCFSEESGDTEQPQKPSEGHPPDYVTPDMNPGGFRRGPGGTYVDTGNGSVWEKDRGGPNAHGGEQWKRWPDAKSWEKDRGRESVWTNGVKR